MENEKLTNLIIKKYGSRSAFAKEIGISEASLTRYLHNTREWKSSALLKAIKALKIPASKIEEYFFIESVSVSKPIRE